VLNDGVVRKSGAILTHHKRSGNSNLGKTFKIRNRTGEFADWKSNSGKYSRYFSLDAWFAERIKLLPKEARKTFPWLIVPKASKAEKYRKLDIVPELSKCPSGIAYNEHSAIHSERNGIFHPTIKPIKLMSWLITLASREGDIVLDPFCGSGTTLIAAKMLSRQYIGIELEKEYYDIARLRIDEVQQNIDSFL
jgi:site-specific DNA-methyltransferase (adenine-specific)